MSEEKVIPMDTLAKVYLKIRASKQKLTKEYEASLADLEQQREEIANVMRENMKMLGLKSVRTDYGTVIMSVKTRYETTDWESFHKFVVENDAVDLLERRIAQKNMAKYLEDNPDKLPPGLNSDSKYDVTVRKPTN
jgi:ribosomal protein L4